jgi:hypothetical protein
MPQSEKESYAVKTQALMSSLPETTFVITTYIYRTLFTRRIFSVAAHSLICPSPDSIRTFRRQEDEKHEFNISS